MAFSYERGTHVEVWAQYLARKLVELDVGRVLERRHDDRGQPFRFCLLKVEERLLRNAIRDAGMYD